jgi:hypothetical protein
LELIRFRRIWLAGFTPAIENQEEHTPLTIRVAAKVSLEMFEHMDGKFSHSETAAP